MDWVRSTCRFLITRVCRCRHKYRGDDDDDDDDDHDNAKKLPASYILQVNTIDEGILTNILAKIGKAKTLLLDEKSTFVKVYNFREFKLYHSLIINNDFYIINGIEIQKYPSKHSFAL